MADAVASRDTSGAALQTAGFRLSKAEALFLQYLIDATAAHGIAPPKGRVIPADVRRIVDYDHVKLLVQRRFAEEDDGTPEGRERYWRRVREALRRPREALTNFKIIATSTRISGTLASAFVGAPSLPQGDPKGTDAMQETELNFFLKYALLPAVVVGATVVGAAYMSGLSAEDAARYASIATIATGFIALVAAIVAFWALVVQGDTAKRRAAIDFFLKTEMEEELIDAFYDFEQLVPQIPAILARGNLSRFDDDCRTIEKWLRMCELVAVGVIGGAFSNSVTLKYWGDVLPKTLRDAHLFIQHVRTAPGWGTSATYCELERLCRRWAGE